MTTKEWWEFEEEEEKKGGFYKLKVGDNKLRILTAFERVDQLFEGMYPNGKYVRMVDENYVTKGEENVNTQGWAWAIDRETGDMVILQVGRGVLKALATLRADDEYAFDDFPMPYDVNIKNTGEGPARYSVVASRKNTPITEEEMTELGAKTPISEILTKIKEKAGTVVEKTKIDYSEDAEGVIPF